MVWLEGAQAGVWINGGGAAKQPAEPLMMSWPGELLTSMARIEPQI